MSRNRGTFNFSANFEPLVKAPLDARMRVDNYVDLIDPSTWKDADGNVWLFKGAIVSVANDPSAGIYFLKDDSGYTNYSNWIPAGSDTDVDVSLNFVNIGSGDVSILAGITGSNVFFRELRAGTGVTLSYYDASTILISAPGSGAGVNGGAFITDINPVSSGNVGDKVYSSDGTVLDSCTTDTQNVTVSVLAITGNSNYKPNVWVKSQPVTLTANADKPLWNGSIDISLNSDSSVHALHEDGAEWYTDISYETPPQILSATFTGGYPGSQTQLKAGDTFDVSIVTDVDVDRIEFINSGAFTNIVIDITDSSNFVIQDVSIANRGTSTTTQPMFVRVRKPSGSWSSTYISSIDSSVDGTGIVSLNNSYPSVSINSIDYPSGQEALKAFESATVSNTVSNYDTISYTSPTGELNITSSTSYQPSKTVTYTSGTYNISTPNFQISANRGANDATTTVSDVVYIANSPATLTVVNPASRFRSGGNDGTSIQNHTITIQSDQQLIADPSLAKDSGSTADWQTSSTFTGGPTTFTNVLQVHDDDTKGTYSWGSIWGKNLAGVVTTSNSGASSYVLGGFVVRTITVPAFGWQTNINVEVSDYSKLSSTGSGQTLAWSVKNLTTRSTLGDTTRPQAGVWSASATGTNPTTINILDKSATDSASQASTYTIQESI